MFLPLQTTPLPCLSLTRSCREFPLLPPLITLQDANFPYQQLLSISRLLPTSTPIKTKASLPNLRSCAFPTNQLPFYHSSICSCSLFGIKASHNNYTSSLTVLAIFSYHLLSLSKIVILFEGICVEGSTVVRYGVPISPVEPKGVVFGRILVGSLEEIL